VSIYLIKSFLAIFFLAAALAAAGSMLTMMGRLEKKTNPLTLRKIHKAAGLGFATLLIVLSFICVVIAGRMGDAMSGRAVFHSVLSLTLLAIFGLKIALVKFYRQFLKYVPGLGMAVLILAFVVFMVSAGYFFLRLAAAPAPGVLTASLASAPDAQAASSESTATPPGNSKKGAELFMGLCASCHFSDKEESSVGPGLKGILKKNKLPASGRPASLDNVRRQILSPYLTMPSFKDISASDLADLLAFLGKL